MLIWSFLIYEPFFDTLHMFCSFSFMWQVLQGKPIIGAATKNESSVRFYISCVYIDSILYVYLYPFCFLFTLLYHSKLYSQRTIWSTTAQSKEVFMYKRCVCVFTPVTVCLPYCHFSSFSGGQVDWQLQQARVRIHRNHSHHILKLYYFEQSVII